MTAEEARKTTLLVNTNATNSQYADVNEVIKLSVNQGKYSTNYYESLVPDVKTKLEAEGYKVTINNAMNETNIEISWR